LTIVLPVVFCRFVTSNCQSCDDVHNMVVYNM
jgi:hypothetical protein